MNIVFQFPFLKNLLNSIQGLITSFFFFFFKNVFEVDGLPIHVFVFLHYLKNVFKVKC